MFSCPASVLLIQTPAIWSVHITNGGHGSGEGGETDCLIKGYKNPPVPRRLVGQSQIPPNLSPACTDSIRHLSGVVFVGQHVKIGPGPRASF